MLSINPNQNSTKAIKGSEKTLRWEILENKIPKHIFNILKKKFINLSQSYKKEQKSPKREREREREREYSQFFCGKNMDWMRKIILNLYKIKWKKEEAKYIKEKMKKKV